MNDELQNELIDHIRRQNLILKRIEKKQAEATWYLWLIALIVVVAIVLPLVFGGLRIVF